MDASTLIFANVLSIISMMGMFGLLAIFRKEVSIRLFEFAYLMIVAAYLFDLLPADGQPWKTLQLLLTNLAFLGSFLLQNSAYRAYCKIQIWPRRNWVYLATFLFLNWYFYAVTPSYLLRVVIFSLTVTLILCDLLFSAILPLPKKTGFLRNLAIFLCIEYASAHLIRIVLLLLYSRQSVSWLVA